tara:strand:+ start:2733 stop:2978 length:246 start_codon:yes stop_codon:yes gene_type:complete
MNENEIDILAEKVAIAIINKLFDAGDLEISHFPPASEEEIMIGELARLTTLMSTYEDKEEYEKAAIIKRKIEILQNKYNKK